jgi:hypothetical protein
MNRLQRLEWWWMRLLLRWPLVGTVLYQWQPRCRTNPPWKIATAEPAAGSCILPAWFAHREGWHADGTGYVWNDHQWVWRGPVVDLAEAYRDLDWDDPDTAVAFTETL